MLLGKSPGGWDTHFVSRGDPARFLHTQGTFLVPEFLPPKVKMALQRRYLFAVRHSDNAEK